MVAIFSKFISLLISVLMMILNLINGTPANPETPNIPEIPEGVTAYLTLPSGYKEILNAGNYHFAE